MSSVHKYLKIKSVTPYRLEQVLLNFEVFLGTFCCAAFWALIKRILSILWFYEVVFRHCSFFQSCVLGKFVLFMFAPCLLLGTPEKIFTEWRRFWELDLLLINILLASGWFASRFRTRINIFLFLPRRFRLVYVVFAACMLWAGATDPKSVTWPQKLIVALQSGANESMTCRKTQLQHS